MAQTFKSLGALLRHYQRDQYVERENGDVAIYKDYRYHWFRRHPDGGYERLYMVSVDARGAVVKQYG